MTDVRVDRRGSAEASGIRLGCADKPSAPDWSYGYTEIFGSVPTVDMRAVWHTWAMGPMTYTLAIRVDARSRTESASVHNCDDVPTNGSSSSLTTADGATGTWRKREAARTVKWRMRVVVPDR